MAQEVLTKSVIALYLFEEATVKVSHLKTLVEIFDYKRYVLEGLAFSV